MKSETVSEWLWRLALVALLGAILSILLLLILALGGISDPRHVGALVVRDDLDRDAGWVLHSGDPSAGAVVRIDNGVYEVILPRSQAHALIEAPYQTRAPCTIMIAASQIDGPTDAGYGLWWGDASGGGYHVAAVNGDGYLAVFQTVGGSTETIVEWQMFPRVHPQGETNTLQVDIEGGQALVRVNDELVTTFAWAPDRMFSAGFYVETFSAGGSIVDFDWLSIWQETNHLP